MAALSATNLTLADWAKRVDPDGDIPVIAEILSQVNAVLQDAIFKQGNLPTGHRVVIRTGLPTVHWRAINEGILPSKSTTSQVDEGVGILEARSEVDKKLARLEDNQAAFRLSEATAFLEAMSQEDASTFFYGNTGTNPKQFMGMAPRYAATTDGNGQNIILGGGAGADNTSIWLIVWGDDTIFRVFPKGSMAGLERDDLGEQTIFDVNGVAGTRMQALAEVFSLTTGLVVKDWRYAVRIPNVEISDLQALTNEQAPTVFTNIIHLMSRSIDRIPMMNRGRAVFYMNRTVMGALRRLGLEKSNGAVTVQEALDQFGRPHESMRFLGIPVHRCDALINTETLVA